MKSIFIVFALSSFIAVNVFATSKWSNCGAGPQTGPIQEAFWRSDINGGSGPDYNLKSGQVLSNIGALCRSGQSLKLNDWITELKNSLNPVKSVSTFKEIRNAEEFQKFLQANSIMIDDPVKLSEAINAYFASKPLPTESTSSMPGPANNPAIIVGSSKKEVVILLASSDGKNQSATLMQIKQK